MRYQAADLVNNMLNYGYGMLYQRVWRAALRAGLNPHISFLHAFQARKPTLVYDLVEEYRQALVDRPLISLLTRGQKGRDLKLDQTSGLLQPDSRNQVSKRWGGLWAGPITFGKKIKAEEVIQHQARISWTIWKAAKLTGLLLRPIKGRRKKAKGLGERG